LPSRARAAASPENDAFARVAAWTRDYRPLPGIPDEFIGADGERRPHWERLLRALADLEPDEIDQRFAAADSRIRNRGMSYRARSSAASSSAPNCSIACSLTSTAKGG